MGWIASFFNSSIGRKIIMSLSGLFLTLFLVTHLTGNLQLLAQDGGKSFNEYAHFMAHNPFIQLVSWTNLLLIIPIHFIMATVMTLKNRKSKGKTGVANKSGSWASRNMYIFGAVIFVFLLIHLNAFWFKSKFTDTLAMVNYGSGEVKDLYSLVQHKFSNILYSGFYIASMLFIAFHLWHGFQSAWQTIGISSDKITPAIKSLGYFIAIAVSLGFAIIPLLMFLRS